MSRWQHYHVEVIGKNGYYAVWTRGDYQSALKLYKEVIQTYNNMALNGVYGTRLKDEAGELTGDIKRGYLTNGKMQLILRKCNKQTCSPKNVFEAVVDANYRKEIKHKNYKYLYDAYNA